MSHSWQSYRLHTHHRLDQVDLLVSQLRAADVGARWYFDRDTIGVDLWVHAAGEAGDEQRAVGGGQPSHRRPPVKDHRNERDTNLTAAIAFTSSDVVRNGELSATAGAPMATLHLALLVWLVPEPVLVPFQLQCWQYWTSRCSRPPLRARGGRSPLLGAGRCSWDRYLRTFRERCEIGSDFSLLSTTRCSPTTGSVSPRPTGHWPAMLYGPLFATCSALLSVAVPAGV